MRNQVLLGDCLKLMPMIPDHSVDMILCDLPYGTTRNRWDVVIPLDVLWEQYKRLIKPKGAIVLTCQTPFDKVLGASNLPWLKYEWIWLKSQGTGHLNANKAPLKRHENILVFCEGQSTYNPQFTPGKPYIKTPSKILSTNYGHFEQTPIDNPGYRYPTSVLEFKSDRGLHPTQKPVSLFEYLISTYTNPGDLVLDNCLGSGTTVIASINCQRDYIGIELDQGYYNTAVLRINKRLREPEPLAI
jgi:site-specific DNA-methyltransferase (adenine-specific)